MLNCAGDPFLIFGLFRCSALSATVFFLLRRAVVMRDFPTIALIRFFPLLRRSGPVRAFSQQTEPGRLWISLTAAMLARPRETF